jgi:hypothetical protein
VTFAAAKRAAERSGSGSGSNASAGGHAGGTGLLTAAPKSFFSRADASAAQPPTTRRASADGTGGPELTQ